MHPALALRGLRDLEKEIVKALSSRGDGMHQSGVVARLPGRPSQSTVSRAMARLVAAGIVEKSGTTRNAAFRLTPAAAWFARPPHLRPPVPYDSARIGAYVPNRTRWLPDAAAEAMRVAAAGVAHRLDASTYSREIAERFLVDLSWASSHLEGNTYDYLDTEALLKYGQEAAGHDLAEATMILDHKNAIGLLLRLVGADVYASDFAFRLHALLMRDLISPEDLGRVRANDVPIGGSSYRPSASRPQLSEDLGALMWKAGQVQDPFEAGFLLLAGIAWLQAFVDGNKRLGRLLCNVPLLWAGLPPLSFVGVDRGDYLAAIVAFYELGDATPLADAIASGYARAAPSYAAAVATRRMPRGVEVRERPRVEGAVSALVAAALAGGPVDMNAFSAAFFADLPEEERRVLEASLREILKGLGPMNAVAWGVDEGRAEAFARKRDQGDFPDL
ncbi:Fic family protein [Myxococcota bacterium]|nr:Fic family protein [Myxococcota bacterium]